MKLGLKDMKKAYKNVNIDKIEVFFFPPIIQIVLGSLRFFLFHHNLIEQVKSPDWGMEY